MIIFCDHDQIHTYNFKIPEPGCPHYSSISFITTVIQKYGYGLEYELLKKWMQPPPINTTVLDMDEAMSPE